VWSPLIWGVEACWLSHGGSNPADGWYRDPGRVLREDTGYCQLAIIFFVELIVGSALVLGFTCTQEVKYVVEEGCRGP